MKKLLKLMGIVLLMLIIAGCDSKTSEATVIEKETKVKQESMVTQSKPKVEPKNHAKAADSAVQSVFQDVAKIGEAGKPMILIFGTNTCPYCMKLKEDIYQSTELQTRLRDDYLTYYFKTHENLVHKLFHEGQYMDVDTKTMISIYGVQATPTLIFTDKNAKAVIMVPGYMPAKQFEVTLDFMASDKWVGKDRKNGEVYQALKDFYIANGIEVVKK
jgi:thioredoxin-related protein